MTQDDIHLKIAEAFAEGYREAWKIIAGRYANDSTESGYVYVSDLIDSLDKAEHQMRIIESKKTKKQYIIVERIQPSELDEMLRDAAESARIARLIQNEEGR